MKLFEGTPETLYKYRIWSNKYHQKILTDREVFLSSPAGLNDPFDASLPFRYDPKEMTPENITRKLLATGRKMWPEISEEELHQRAFDEQHSGKFDDEQYWKQAHAATKEDLHKTFGVLSLTSKPDNLLMWAHYADSHKGFCVGLDRDILYDVVKGSIGPVTYQEEFPLMPLFPKEGENVETMVRMLNTKSPHWDYEDEYRLTKHSASNIGFVLPSEGIKEIILGNTMSLKDREEIIGAVDKHLPKCRILEAKTNAVAFKLDINATYRIG